MSGTHLSKYRRDEKLCVIVFDRCRSNMKTWTTQPQTSADLKMSCIRESVCWHVICVNSQNKSAGAATVFQRSKKVSRNHLLCFNFQVNLRIGNTPPHYITELVQFSPNLYLAKFGISATGRILNLAASWVVFLFYM